MTKLQPEKPIVRETGAFERGFPIVVTLHPRYMELRVKGTRTAVVVDYEAALDLGRKLAWRRRQ